jgi:hypothetical protein
MTTWNWRRGKLTSVTRHVGGQKVGRILSSGYEFVFMTRFGNFCGMKHGNNPVMKNDELWFRIVRDGSVTISLVWPLWRIKPEASRKGPATHLDYSVRSNNRAATAYLIQTLIHLKRPGRVNSTFQTIFIRTVKASQRQCLDEEAGREQRTVKGPFSYTEQFFRTRSDKNNQVVSEYALLGPPMHSFSFRIS